MKKKSIVYEMFLIIVVVCLHVGVVYGQIHNKQVVQNEEVKEWKDLKLCNYKEDYMCIHLRDKIITVEGKTNKPLGRKFKCLQIKKGDMSVAREFDSGDEKGNFIVKKKVTSDKGDYKLSLYVAKTKCSSYRSWIWDLPIRKGKEGFCFNVSPVYKNNCEKYYKQKSSKNTKEYLKNTSSIQSDDKTIVELANDITKESDNDYDKAVLIHDWVAQNIYYNYDGFYKKEYGDNSAIGTLKNKMAVCEGYANLTAALLRASHIPCKVVNGYGLGVGTKKVWDEEIIQGSQTNHAWNEAYINNRWIIIDVTWDSGNVYKHGKYVQDGVRDHNYFDSTLEFFSINHKIVND